MQPAQTPTANVNSYWANRQNLLYYNAFRVLADGLSQDAGSILDVGSAGCPYLDWFPHIQERVSLDMERPYRGPGITSVKMNFLEWEPGRRFDVVTCLQVLEHVPPAGQFAKKLLSLGDIVIISVPYKWSQGTAKTHVHDPVDESKLRDWFGRAPNFEYICREIAMRRRRLIQVYELGTDKWGNLPDRNKLRARQQAQEQALTGVAAVPQEASRS